MSTNRSADPKSALDAYVESFNADEYTKVRAVLALDFRRIAPDFNANGPEEMIAGMRNVHETYADFHLTINDAVFSAEIGFCRWTATGTYTSGDGTKTPLEVSGATMMRFADAKITEEWVYYDTAAAARAMNVASLPHGMT